MTNARVNVMSILFACLDTSMFFLSSTIRVTVRAVRRRHRDRGNGGSTALTVTVALSWTATVPAAVGLRAFQRGFNGAAALFTRLDELQHERLVIGDVHLLADLELVNRCTAGPIRVRVLVPLSSRSVSVTVVVSIAWIVALIITTLAFVTGA